MINNNILILLKNILKISVVTYLLFLLNIKIEKSLVIAVLIVSFYDFYNKFIENFIENFSSDKVIDLIKDDTSIKTNSTGKSSNLNETTNKDKIVNNNKDNSQNIVNNNTDEKSPDLKTTDLKPSDLKSSDSNKKQFSPSALVSIGLENTKKYEGVSAINSNLGLENCKKNEGVSTVNSDVGLKNEGISAINSHLGLDINSDEDNNFITKESSKKNNKSDTSKIECTPVIPQLLFTDSTNKNYIVRISTNFTSINSFGKCVVNDHPSEYNLVLGRYKLLKSINQDKFYEIPKNIIKINNEEKNIKKGINLFVKKGYKITFISKSGIKTFIGLASTIDTPFINSDQIKKGLKDISEILIEKIVV